jgi:hypothetical protein
MDTDEVEVLVPTAGVERGGTRIADVIVVSMHTLTAAAVPVHVPRAGAMGDLQRAIHEEHSGPPPDGMKLLKDKGGRPDDAYSEDAFMTLESLGIVDGTVVHMTGQDEVAGRARREAREQARRNAEERRKQERRDVEERHKQEQRDAAARRKQEQKDAATRRNREQREEQEQTKLARLRRRTLLVLLLLLALLLLLLSVIWLIVDLAAGCVLRGCGEHGSCGGFVVGSCDCTDNFAGEFCDLDLSSCDCNGHGNQTDVAGVRATGSCNGGSCACTESFVGGTCQHDISAFAASYMLSGSEGETNVDGTYSLVDAACTGPSTAECEKELYDGGWGRMKVQTVCGGCDPGSPTTCGAGAPVYQCCNQGVDSEGLVLFRQGSTWYVGPSSALASCTATWMAGEHRRMDYYATRPLTSGQEPGAPDDDAAYEGWVEDIGAVGGHRHDDQETALVIRPSGGGSVGGR